MSSDITFSCSTPRHEHRSPELAAVCDRERARAACDPTATPLEVYVATRDAYRARIVDTYAVATLSYFWFWS